MEKIFFFKELCKYYLDSKKMYIKEWGRHHINSNICNEDKIHKTILSTMCSLKIKMADVVAMVFRTAAITSHGNRVRGGHEIT